MKTNKKAYLQEENLLSLLSLNNMIVPEIQREYVWGKKENEAVLTKFLMNIKENCNLCNTCKQIFKKKDVNIGFLYSYKPSYVTLDNERYLDEFLIDGQQRYTTLFLLLAYLAVKEDRVKDFLLLVRFNKDLEEINFDYKVRNLTHRFLIEFLSTFNENIKIEDIIPINKNGILTISQTWFLSDYFFDTTVQGMLGTLCKISEIFNEDFLYFDYVLTSVRFWHFKTEATSQGEELYITMNSRGKRLEVNEEQKVLILQTEELPKWGKKWEEWQDFFWKNKNKNMNADNGFKEFIRWIMEIEENKLPSPEIVENYFNVVEFLFNKERGVFKEKDNLEWLAPDDDGNNQIVLFELLPVILYVKRFGINTQALKINRVWNFFKNLARTDNVKRSVKDLVPRSIQVIKELPNDDIASIIDIPDVSTQILSKEEILKFRLYTNSSYNREELEDRFWKAEEHIIWKGQIEPLIHWSCGYDTDNIYYDINTFDIELFDQYNGVFNKIFHKDLNDPTLDLIRRVLLTRNLRQYPKIFRGNTNYSFCWEPSDWRILISENISEFGKLMKDLFGSLEIDKEFHNMIQSFINTIPFEVNDKDKYDIVKYEGLLMYSEEKNAQKWGSDWVLIKRKNATSYMYVKTFLLFKDIEETYKGSWNIWLWDGGRGVADEVPDKNKIAVDFFFNGSNYSILFFDRDEYQTKTIEEIREMLLKRCPCIKFALNIDNRFEVQTDYDMAKRIILDLIN